MGLFLESPSNVCRLSHFVSYIEPIPECCPWCPGVSMRACSNSLSLGLHKHHHLYHLKLGFRRRCFGAESRRLQRSLSRRREFKVERNRSKEYLQGDAGSMYGGLSADVNGLGVENIVGRRGHVFCAAVVPDGEPRLSIKEIRRPKDGASVDSKSGGSQDPQEKSTKVGNEGEDPYRILEDGRKVYLKEYDVITLLDPPPSLQPLDRSTYNHAAFLWKKIGDVPEERRSHLFSFLSPELISKMWEVAGLRYDDPRYVKQDPAALLLGSSVEDVKSWHGFVTEVPWLLGWLSRFKMAFFNGSDGSVYGRAIVGGHLLQTIADVFAPLYFQVKAASNVAGVEEEECDLAFDFGDGQFQIKESLPPQFPAPGKHPPPFNKPLIAYIRPVGPGMLVGQMWYKHEVSDEPRKFLGAFVLQQDLLTFPN